MNVHLGRVIDSFDPRASEDGAHSGVSSVSTVVSTDARSLCESCHASGIDIERPFLSFTKFSVTAPIDCPNGGEMSRGEIRQVDLFDQLERICDSFDPRAREDSLHSGVPLISTVDSTRLPFDSAHDCDLDYKHSDN